MYICLPSLEADPCDVLMGVVWQAGGDEFTVPSRRGCTDVLFLVRQTSKTIHVHTYIYVCVCGGV